MIKTVAITLLVCAATAARADEAVNPDIWSISYWEDLARRGIVPYNEALPVAPAFEMDEYGSGGGGPATNSADVAVSLNANFPQSENSIFVDPVMPSRAFNSNNSGDPSNRFKGTSYFVTDDAGVTWNGTYEPAGGTNRGDPAAVIDWEGTLYVGFINSNGGQSIARSTNDGLTWATTSIYVDPTNALMDKNHLWIDNSRTSPWSGNLYSAWTEFTGTAPWDINLSRSTNGGITWLARTNLSGAVTATNHNQGVNIQTGPNGEVYVVWSIYDASSSVTDETALGFSSSTNGGATFSPGTRILTAIRGIRNSCAPGGPLNRKQMRMNSFPSMACDISFSPYRGNLYVVWPNIGVPGVNTGQDVDIYMIRSTNRGATWSAPLRINSDTVGQSNHHYFSWITCDPESGALSAIFYDDRNCAANAFETWVANSDDGGVTWTNYRISDVQFTPSPVTGFAANYFGDYLGISARGGQVYPCWTDNRVGAGFALTYLSPYENTVSNLNLQHNSFITTRVFKAFNSIRASTSLVVTANGDVEFRAGTQVRLEPGFVARSGSVFRAMIDPAL